MKAVRSKILIVEQQVSIRTKICTWLSQEGYAIFECKDAFKTLRLARQILPDLILLDTSIRGINTKQLIEIIETDQLSKVVLTAESINDDFMHLLDETTLKKFVKKPVDRSEMMQVIKTSLEEISEAKKAKSQRDRELTDSAKAAAIVKAKELIMSKWNLTEDQAYAYLRKKSMNYSVPIEYIAKAVIKKYQPKP
jgi:response regulator NasT